MKKIYFFLLAICLTGTACGEKEPKEAENETDCGNEVATISLEGATLCVDPYTILSFKGTYLRDCQKDEVYFIKGVANDVYEYGRTIEIIEDLKGNYTGRSSIFVWGSGCSSQGGGCIIGDRFDNMLQYNDNDTLIMMTTAALSPLAAAEHAITSPAAIPIIISRLYV